MADLTYEIGVNTTQAQRGLDNLNQKVANISKAFDGLRQAIVGIAFGSLVQNALRYADAINDVADATGFAVDTVNKFSQAVQQSGGNVDGAQNALLRFSQTIGEAREGSKSAQAAFLRIGVSLDDLATLDDEQLFKKTIDNLSKIPSLAEQARLKADLFGKTLRGASLSGVQAGMAEDLGGASTQGIQAAAAAQDNLTKIMFQFQQAVVNALTPLNEFIKDLRISQDQINDFVDSAKQVGGALLFLATLIPLGRAFKLAAGGAKSLVLVLRDLGQILKNLPQILRNLPTIVKEFTKLSSVGARIVAFFEALGVPLGGIIALFQKMPIVVTGAILSILEFLGLLDPITNFANDIAKSFGNMWDSMTDKGKFIGPKITADQLGAQDAEFKKVSQGIDDIINATARRNAIVVNAYDKEIIAIKQTSKEYDQFNKDLIDNINIQTKAIQRGSIFAQQQDAVNQVLKRSADDIQNLRNQLSNLSEDEKLAGLDKIILGQISLIQKRTQAYADGAKAAVQALQNEQAAIQITTNQLEDNLDSMSAKINVDNLRAQLDLIGLTGDAYDRMAAKLTMEADLKKQLNDIEADRQRLLSNTNNMTVAAFQAEMDILDQREQRARQTADALYNIEVNRINKERALRNSAQAGIADYFNQVAQSMEPYEMAQKKVGAIWGNMETTIDNFTKTGKLKMKDFALSVIQDLIAIELKAMALAALKAVLTMFGIPMLAKGGPAQQGKPYIVGEKGPELFVPRSSGQVVPNDELAGMAAGRASSQPVTNNYYTIQAVDAKSVAQLFYENRKTMLGTVKMAERELSYRI